MAVSAFPLAAQAPGGGAAIEKAVLEASARSTAAAESLDVDGLFGFMLDTDKGSVIQGGILVPTREQALQQTRNRFRGIRAIRYNWKRRLVTVLSPTVALLVGDGESTFTTESGDTITTPFAQTAVFVLTGGEWKIQHAHHSTPPRAR